MHPARARGDGRRGQDPRGGAGRKLGGNVCDPGTAWLTHTVSEDRGDQRFGSALLEHSESEITEKSRK